MSFLIMHYPYMFGVILFFFPWVFLFITHKESRREMLTMGAVFGVAAFLASKYALVDYWNPAYLIPHFRLEEFFYGFFFGGFSVEASRLFFVQKIRHHHHRFWFAILTAFLCVIALVLVLRVFHWNSIISFLVPLAVVGIVCVFYNRTLITFQIVSGMIAVSVTVTVFWIILLINPHVVETTWNLNNLSGILITGIPLEELLFAFLLGFGGSSFYEIVEGEE